MSISQINNEMIIPETLRRQGLNLGFVYQGLSMQPTFRPGQLLYIRPEVRDFTPGDIIVFFDPDRPGYVVHRIRAISILGLTTQGDNNLHRDPVPVLPDQVIGRVEQVEHQNQLHHVIGGKKGLVLAQSGLRLRWVLRLISPILGRPYRWLRRSGWVKQVWQPHMVQVYLQNDQGIVIKYIYRGHTIARWWPHNERFECRKPYDLILRREDLPLDVS